MAWFVKGPCNLVHRLVDRGNKANLMTSESNHFTDEVVVQLNVTCAGMKNWIGRHVSGAETVTIEED
ncbi:unnamed protein product [Prunus armeniaca]|uniref:Uncharacterized protein n=1 Tax=Prunus armeniaca TaxID=36596 RepID=A0A6J5UR59_PRUAR|nr:unnamed protein product [Prunus armeniaca]